MDFLKTIFLNIAKRLGLQLQEKPVQVDDYSNIDSISLTAVIAQRVSTLTLQDSSISISNDGARAKFMQEFLDEYLFDRMDAAAEVSLGTGDCLVKPYTDGKRIGIDIIKNGDFVVCDSIGNYIKSCIIKTGEITTEDGIKYERFEAQMVKETTAENGETISFLVIQNTAYKNGRQIPLDMVDAWARIKPEEYIPNVSAPLFGRYKCPAVNRQNINGTNGVKITYGLDSVMTKAVEAYERFNSEFEAKEPFIFADKTLFTKDKDGNMSLPAGKNKLFLKVRGEDGELIQEYSPAIRSADLDSGIQANFKMLELLTGLSPGILTPPTTTFATATEIKAALLASYAFMVRFRRQLEHGTKQLLNSVNYIANRNNLAPIGEWDVEFSWSDGYIEQMSEHFNQLMEAQGVGAVSKAEIRSWLMNEDMEVAEKAIANIAETEPTRLSFGDGEVI